MAELIRRHGGTPLSAPAMREVAREDRRDLLDYLAALEAGEIDVVVLLTGVGLRTLVKQVEPEWSRERVAAALRRATLVARGPKPVAALRELGLRPEVTVPEPNTWKELLATLDAELPVNGRCVAVQEYGISNRELMDGLQARGARLRRVSIYEWALPEDLGPLHSALAAIVAGAVDVVLFTSAHQVFTVFQIAADSLQGAASLRRALQGIVVASIGPICSDALREHGIPADIEPVHAKMGQLVAAAAERARPLLNTKRAASPGAAG
jgi:uroporphyrinogen-III synthase